MSKAAQKKEKQDWAVQKPELDNAQRLRGIYFIDPEDGEQKDTIKKARKKLEIPMESAILCKMGTKKRSMKLRETARETTESNKETKHACIVEAHESTRKRLESTLPRNHEDHIAEKGFNSISHCNLVHEFVPMPQAMNVPDAKTAVDKEWEKLEKLTAWQLDKVKSKKEAILEAQQEQKKVHVAALMEICHLKNAELEPKHQKYKGRVVLRGDLVKDDAGAYARQTQHQVH